MRRVLDIRRIVVTSINNHPIRVADLVEGGPLEAESGTEADSLSPVYDARVGKEGVIVGYQTRLGRISRQLTEKTYPGEDDKVQATTLMRKGEASLVTTEAVKAKIDELNTIPGRLLPGVRLEVHWDVSGLLHVTTHTVQENLLVGMGLVTIILLMFLSNVRSALIVAINIPLALLFAFTVMFLRGKSANLLSIGAVDFGIIVDSSVIMVENIYRHISSGEDSHLPLKDRILKASREVEKSLMFSTAIMVCSSFLPLFTMTRPGRANLPAPWRRHTPSRPVGGALLLAVTVAPVLCLMFFKHLKPARDNFLVRFLKSGYLRNLDFCLRHRWATMVVMGGLMALTFSLLPWLGREFLPALEEGNVYVHGTFPVDVSLEEVAAKARIGQKVMRGFPRSCWCNRRWAGPTTAPIPRATTTTSTTSHSSRRSNGPATFGRAETQMAEVRGAARGEFFLFKGWYGLLDMSEKLFYGPTRARTKDELIDDMKVELNRYVPGVDWNFSQYIRDNVTESLSGVKGDNSLKIFGPSLEELERLAIDAKAVMETVPGIKDVDIFPHPRGSPTWRSRPTRSSATATVSRRPTSRE